MLDTLLLLSALQAQPAAPPQAEEGPAIVVTGTRRGRCRVRLAARTLSDRELAAHAREWAALGRPVRVIRPAGADYRCLARIAFRLQDRGVRLIHFVDPPEPPRQP
ncbi:MAG TPA: hypothetical protein VD887_09570 [Allosphingosinicella sp.]|nr:hypothetical protein [Allosphingosinicella sp.]